MFDDQPSTFGATAGARAPRSLPASLMTPPRSSGRPLASDGAPEPFGESLADLAPDSVLARILEGTDEGKLDDFALVEMVAGWRRVAAWAAARAARAAARLAERPSMNPTRPAVTGHVGEAPVAGDELALRLGWSRRAGDDLVRAGRAFEGVLRPTGEALERGDIDEGKARLVRDALASAPLAVAIEVQELVLPQAPGRTSTQLARDLDQALLEVEARVSPERVARPVSDRSARSAGDLPDGMPRAAGLRPSSSAVAVSDHRITTDSGFTLEQVATGVLVWTTPTGHRYVRKPDGLAPALARGDGPLRSRVGALVGTALDEGARRGGGCLPLDDPPF